MTAEFLLAASVPQFKVMFMQPHCHGLPDREEPSLLLLATAGPFLISQLKMSTENTTAFPAAALK